MPAWIVAASAGTWTDPVALFARVHASNRGKAVREARDLKERPPVSSELGREATRVEDTLWFRPRSIYWLDCARMGTLLKLTSCLAPPVNYEILTFLHGVPMPKACGHDPALIARCAYPTVSTWRPCRETNDGCTG